MSVDTILDALLEDGVSVSGFVSIQVPAEREDDVIETIEANGGRVTDTNPHEAGVTISFDTRQFGVN